MPTLSNRSYAIEVEGLSKAYNISNAGLGRITASEAMMRKLRQPFARPGREVYWALKDVSFRIPRGEAVAVIGRNGAGKSTLLKVLSRITSPTEGKCTMRGRLGSLLEVGTGFHPELTGRENIYLNGTLIGMQNREINRQFDAIVEFSGVERFLDTPVKRYSSGMYVRLAFAVAAHLNPEILVIDEVLAVGDSEFQKKCLGKMQDVAKGGRTVLFVSHNMATVNSLCTSAIYLKQGRVQAIGTTGDIVSQYLGDLQKTDENVDLSSLRDSNMGTDTRFTSIELLTDQGAYVHYNSPITITLNIESNTNQKDLRIGGSIYDSTAACVGTFFNHDAFSIGIGERKVMQLSIDRTGLVPGSYHMAFALGRGGEDSSRQELDIIKGHPTFEVLPYSADEQSVVAMWLPQWGSVNFQNTRVVEVQGQPA